MTTRTRSNVFAATIVAGSGFGVLFAACSSPFDSCEAHRTCPASNGGGGAGDEDIGEGGSPPAVAGTVGSGGTAGTGTPAPEPEAGQSGLGGAGGGSPTEDIGGAAGSGSEGIALDSPCSENAALACAGSAQKLSLICRGGRWQPNETCSSDENCDSETGTCAPIAPECDGRAPGETFCNDDVLVECGSDFVTAEETSCEGRCVGASEAATCTPPVCGDGKLQRAEKCDDGNVASGDGCSSQCTVAVVALVAGMTHTCALGGNGVIKCWGLNDHGQLGLGDTLNRGDEPGELGEVLSAVDLGTGPTATAISAAGGYQTCAILDDRSVKCWGDGWGLGDSERRGDQPGEMGDALPRIDLGSGRSPKHISVAADHTCALLDNNAVKCWGSNFFGYLGLGDKNSRGYVPGQMGDALPAVDLWPGAVSSVAAGWASTCAILGAGQVKCWGSTAAGYVGDEPGEMGANLPFLNLGTGRTATIIQTGLAATCAVLDDGSLKCWAWDDTRTGDALPQMNLGAGRSAQSVSIGHMQFCALLDDGSVKCWGGDGDYAGYGALTSTASPPPIDLGTNRKARLIAAGSTHACAALDDDSVKCWGRNLWGALGVGDKVDHGLELTDRGDALRAVDLVF